MIETIVFSAGMGILFVIVAGLRRWPWRYAGLVGLGWGVVLVALRLSQEHLDPGLLVMLGGLGGSLATLGSERGERERARRSASILTRPPSTID